MKTQLKIKLAEGIKTVDVQYSEFPDKDSYCLIKQTDGIAGNPVMVIHELYPDQNDQIVKLLLLLDLLDELGASTVSLLAPYLPYARQDKRHLAGEAISANTLSKMLSRAGVRTLYTFDCHFMKGSPEITHHDLHIVNISLGPYLLDYFKENVATAPYEVIGPDKGSSYFLEAYGNKNMYKERGDYDDTTVRHRSVNKLEHDHLKLDSESVVIIDDMISTGGTLIRAVENIRSRGIEDIYCIATHGLFINGCYAKLSKLAKRVIVSDSIENEHAVAMVGRVLDEVIIPQWLGYDNSAQ